MTLNVVLHYLTDVGIAVGASYVKSGRPILSATKKVAIKSGS